MCGPEAIILPTVITFLMLNLFCLEHYPVLYYSLRIVVIWAVTVMGQTLVMHPCTGKMREVQEVDISNGAEEQ